jgi:Asp-tRNA(Asn)/Glu-tRNA(Gln) amidotransferase A subunit family amidase
MNNWADATASQIVSAVKAKKISARDVAVACLNRIEDRNSTLNFYGSNSFARPDGGFCSG